MLRHKIVWDNELQEQVSVPFTPEKEAAQDAEEAASQAELIGFTPTPNPRIAELLTIPRANWTAAQRAELLELLARDATR